MSCSVMCYDVIPKMSCIIIETQKLQSKEIIDKRSIEQECIPVGCVPSASVAICWPGEGLRHTHPRNRHPPGAGTPLGYHLQGMLGYHPHPHGPTHTCKNITFATSLWTVIVGDSRLWKDNDRRR